MFGILALVFRSQSSYGCANILANQTKVLLTRNILFAKCRSVLAVNYGIRPNFYEEHTLSHKILEYFRASTFNLSPLALEEVHKPLPIINVSDEKYAIKRLLLVITHNPEVKISDILQLFSLFATYRDSVLHTLISEKVLMKNVQCKILDSFHLMDVEELQELAISLQRVKSLRLAFMYSIGSSLANHCELRVEGAGLSQAIQLLNVLVILYGNKVWKRREFATFMSIFKTKVNDAQPQELVQILYYIAIRKSKGLSQEVSERLMSKLEDHLRFLNFCDVGIAAAGVLKLGVAIEKSSPFVIHAAHYMLLKLKEDSFSSDLESYALRAIIKLLRSVKYEDNEILAQLSQFILKNSEINLTHQIIPQILAFYASMRVYERDVFSKMEKLVLDHLMQEPSSIHIKEITRVLWCFSHVGHECSPQFLNAVDKYLLNFVNGPEIARNSQHLSDSLFSLAICHHYPEALIKKAFALAVTGHLKGQQRNKQLSRLYMLYETIQIEAPELALEKTFVSKEILPVRTLAEDILHRPGLAKLMEGADFINKITGSDVFKLKFLLPSINYSNLILDLDELRRVLSKYSPKDFVEHSHIIKHLSLVHEKSNGNLLAIEILEPEFLIKTTSNPIGIINLKLHLLHLSGWDIKILDYKEVEECGNDQKAIAALLLSELVTSE